MKKVLSALLAVTLICVCFAGCGGSTGEKEANVIRIGVFEPTTGENGGGGMQEVLGARYANEVCNKVTIDGVEYTIKLEEVDNQSDKTAAVTAAQTLVNKKVAAVIGSYGSGVSIAAGETFKSATIPAIGCSCTNPQVTAGNDYYFRVCFLDPFQGEVMASYAYATSDCKKAAIITQNGDDYSTGLGSYFKEAYVKFGGKVVYEGTYNTNETDFNAILTKAKAASPEVLFIPSSIQTAGLIIKQARELGITCPIMAGDTWQNATIMTNAGADNCNGVYYSTFFSSTDAAAADFVKGFTEFLEKGNNKELNGGTTEIASVAALGYDSYMTAVKALENAKIVDGKVDTASVRDAIAALDFDGVTGHIVFDKNGDADKSVAFIETMKDGAFSFVGYQNKDGSFTAAK